MLEFGDVEFFPVFEDVFDLVDAGGADVVAVAVLVVGAEQFENGAFLQHVPHFGVVRPENAFQVVEHQVDEPVEFHHAVEVEVAERHPLEGELAAFFALGAGLPQVRGRDLVDGAGEADLLEVGILVPFDDPDEAEHLEGGGIVGVFDGLVLVRTGLDETLHLVEIPLHQVREPFGGPGAQVVVQGGNHPRLGPEPGHVEAEEIADVGKFRLGILLEECLEVCHRTTLLGDANMGNFLEN